MLRLSENITDKEVI